MVFFHDGKEEFLAALCGKMKKINHAKEKCEWTRKSYRIKNIALQK